jgi:hypothetical protein
MARYEQLPIYKKALELVVFLERAVRGFSRFHKYSISERLRGISWDLITGIVKANNVTTPPEARHPKPMAPPWGI